MGDKSGASYGNFDYWIVKMSAAGVKEWDRTLGGSRLDQFWTLEPTLDGGIIIGGNSSSDANGIKTQDDRTPELEERGDYWIVKLDKDGEIEWDKTIGGTNSDALRGLKQTSDGGYILSGLTKLRVLGGTAIIGSLNLQRKCHPYPSPWPNSRRQKKTIRHYLPGKPLPNLPVSILRSSTAEPANPGIQLAL